MKHNRFVSFKLRLLVAALLTMVSIVCWLFVVVVVDTFA